VGNSSTSIASVPPPKFKPVTVASVKSTLPFILMLSAESINSPFSLSLVASSSILALSFLFEYKAIPPPASTLTLPF